MQTEPETTPHRSLRVGLIGAGRIGQVHAANLARHPGVEFAWVADPFLAAAQRVADTYGVRPTEDAKELLEDPDLDAILICTPTPTHVDLITAGVNRGLAVLCEKPVDLDLARARECRDAVVDAERPVMMGFNRRFDPAFAAVKQRVSHGDVGRLEQLTITSRDPAPAPAEYIRVSGGIFRDMTIHDFDMARFFLPDIVEVTAFGSATFCDYISDAGDYDSAVVLLRGRDGELVTITNSRHSAYGYDQRLEAFGTDGMLSAGNYSPTSVRRYGADGVDQAGAYEPFFLERYAQAYRRELDHFVEAAATGGPCSPTLDDGVAALELADAALESARTGRSVRLDQSSKDKH